MTLNVKNIELLAPAGNMERLHSAVYFGADAVYLGGKSFSLRAQSGNFDNDELRQAVEFCHLYGKKCYITLNIFAFNDDFALIEDYLKYLSHIKVDALIISDAGVLSVARKVVPNMSLHLSTQANTTNKYSAAFWAEMGVCRIVLARELELKSIRQIRDYLDDRVELEAFVHGAMCMSFSGRCLLSDYLANRHSNRGECAQSCRWEYALVEKNRMDEQMPVFEDERGSYILNSKDMNMILHIDKLLDAGISSLKIEGRAKTAYYVANTVNSYRRAIDIYTKNGNKLPLELVKPLHDELFKASHRSYFTGFYLGEKDSQYTLSSRPEQTYKFAAIVTQNKDAEGFVTLQQRNRFKLGDELEVLSPSNSFNKKLIVEKMTDLNGNDINDALVVQQSIRLKTDLSLQKGDILRIK